MHVHRRLRLVGILLAAEESGLTPLAAREVHAVAYFADALAPVWELRVLDGQVSKLSEGPFSRPLQTELDWLAGRGVLAVSSVRHRKNAEGAWRLDASYAPNEPLARPIAEAASEFEPFARELSFLREVVFAMSAFGQVGIASASGSDAAYGDEAIAFGNMVHVASERPEPNLTSQVALRFGELLEPEVSLSEAEKVHLYVRELSRRLESVG